MTKPKLVFFQQHCDEHLPAFLLLHKREHVKCLSQFFDVTIVGEACDYRQICDTYEPDLTLFESSLPFASSRRLQIANARAYSGIPKVGFLHSDPFGEGRAGFFSDMEQWGIETFFAIATTAAEHMPEIADRLYVWPNFADPDLYRDYGQWKSIPVLFTGSTQALYPWRQKVIRRVSARYPSLLWPHPGHSPTNAAIQVLSGERYARTLNASWIVPACGSIAREVLRKHFEIPACKACLVTESSPGLEAAGFVDMKNCVLADESDILNKLAYLFDNSDELQAIIDAGYQLVQSRHTLKQRDQLFQWFILRKTLQASERIIQVSPFEQLRVIDASTRLRTSHIISNGAHLRLLREGDHKLWRGKYEEAETDYVKCANYIPWMPEPQVRLALCNLYRGYAAAALSCILKPIHFTLVEYNAVDPDPVEWAYFIVSLLCLGKLDDAVKRSRDFPSLNHPELARVRWVVMLLQNGGNAPRLRVELGRRPRPSIHQLPSRSLKEWTRHISAMLRACGQKSWAETLRQCSETTRTFREEQSLDTPDEQIPTIEEQDVLARVAHTGAAVFKTYSPAAVCRKRVGCDQMKSVFRLALKRSLRNFLHRLEAKYGYFLPYNKSEAKNDEFFRRVEAVTRDNEVKSVLVVGVASRSGTSSAVLAGARANTTKTSVFCVELLGRRVIPRRTTVSTAAVIKRYRLASGPPQDSTKRLEATIKAIQEDNHINCFDVVVIDASEVKHQVASAVRKYLLEARFVVLDDINNPYNQETYHLLLRNPNYGVVDHDPGLRNGYAIFERLSEKRTANVGGSLL
jgi:hypothetical protein